MPSVRGASEKAASSQVQPSLPRVSFLIFPIAGFFLALMLGLPGAQFAPDAGQYRLLALGARGSVPAPFSARVLAPWLAGMLGRVTGKGVDFGFELLGLVCLGLFLALMARLFWSVRAPAAIFAAVFLLPFWTDVLHDYYLPDLIHGLLVAGMLLCLFFGQTTLALLLLFPAYLARESTLLLALCLVFACWRRVRLWQALVGLAAFFAAGLVSRHFAHGSPTSIHGLTGGVYIAGKLIWSFFKNGLGLPLWSNTLPECQPIWIKQLPPLRLFGAIRTVGVCPPDIWGPARLALAWLGLFGSAPAFFVACRRSIFPSTVPGLWGEPKGDTAVANPGWPTGMLIALRLSIVYGLISILMTPVLGASVDRLVEYGWPFALVALPLFVFRFYEFTRAQAAGLLALHLVSCWVAWLGFHEQTNAAYLVAGSLVIVTNGVSYALIQRFQALSKRVTLP